MSVDIRDVLEKEDGRGVNVYREKNNFLPILTFRNR